MIAAAPIRSGVAGWIAARAALWGRRAMAKTKAPFDVELTSDVMERMRDGVRPAIDIYRPARNGRRLAGPASR